MLLVTLFHFKNIVVDWLKSRQTDRQTALRMVLNGSFVELSAAIRSPYVLSEVHIIWIKFPLHLHSAASFVAPFSPLSCLPLLTDR